MGTTFRSKDPIEDTSISNNGAILPLDQGNVTYRVTPAQLRTQAVAVCSSASDTVSKTATVNNMADFVLKNGMIVTVYFENKNTATSPSLNINNTGSIPLRLENQASGVTIGNECWGDGALLSLQYVEVSSTQKYFLMLGHNLASKSTEYNVLSDNTFVYSSSQVDSNFSKIDIFKSKTYKKDDSYIANEFSFIANLDNDGINGYTPIFVYKADLNSYQLQPIIINYTRSEGAGTYLVVKNLSSDIIPKLTWRFIVIFINNKYIDK